MDLNHITLDVADLERSATFYELFGMKRIVWSPSRYARLERDRGRRRYRSIMPKQLASTSRDSVTSSAHC